MMEVQVVESLEVVDLQPYRTLRRPLEHMRKGIFVAEGERVVRRLFRSPLTVLSVLTTPEWFDQYERESLWSSRDIPIVYIANQKLLETIVGYRLHQGIMAVGRVPANPSLEEVMAFDEGAIVALDGIVSAENVGVVARNCAALDARALVFDHTTSSPYLRRAVRNSMGGVFRIPICQQPDLVESLELLRTRYGFHVIGADPQGKKAVVGYKFPPKTCVVMGNEGSGLSAKTLDKCDETVFIPMKNSTDSLNVAVASAIFLYEFRRRMDEKQSH